MNKISTKEHQDYTRILNTILTVERFRNEAVENKKTAKKEKDDDALAIAKRDIARFEVDLLRLRQDLHDAEVTMHKTALEIAVARTRMYVLSYCLQGAVFDLKCLMDKHCIRDGGERNYCDELKQCSDFLMKMPMEFGTYGKGDNESFNCIEEIISTEVEKGVRAAFDEMLKQDLEKIK